MQRLYDYSVLILICIYLFVRQLFNNSIINIYFFLKKERLY